MQIAIETQIDDVVDNRLVEGPRTNSCKSSLEVGKKMSLHSCDRDNLKSLPSNDKCDRDTTIILLRKEIESALQSLKDVQIEMEKLRKENKDIVKSEQKTRESLKCFTNQVHNLQSSMNDFESQSKLKMEALNQRLETSEQIMAEAGSHLNETREVIRDFFQTFDFRTLHDSSCNHIILLTCFQPF